MGKVIVRIWYKDKASEFIKKVATNSLSLLASQIGLHKNKIRDVDKPGVGHVSLEIFDGETKKYISFWPANHLATPIGKTGVESSLVESKETDEKFEAGIDLSLHGNSNIPGRRCDKEITLNSLATDKIIKKFHIFHNCFISSNSTEKPNWSLLASSFLRTGNALNCAQFALIFLLEGEIDKLFNENDKNFRTEYAKSILSYKTKHNLHFFFKSAIPFFLLCLYIFFILYLTIYRALNLNIHDMEPFYRDALHAFQNFIFDIVDAMKSDFFSKNNVLSPNSNVRNCLASQLEKLKDSTTITFENLIITPDDIGDLATMACEAEIWKKNMQEFKATQNLSLKNRVDYMYNLFLELKQEKIKYPSATFKP
jgi:hypothetical protein